MVRISWLPHEVLVNAETGNMGTSRHFSDFPTTSH